MWQIYSRKYFYRYAYEVHESNRFMVIGRQLKVDLKLDFGLFRVFWNTDFFVYMDGHPQATVVLFPWSLATDGFMEATIGIAICLFV